MTQWFTSLLILMVLVFAVYNAWENEGSRHNHVEHFDKVRDFEKEMRAHKAEVEEFMAKGGRNTAKMGYDECVRQQKDDYTAGREQADCAAIYGIEE